SRSLVAHTQPHTKLQLLASHTLTHSWCVVKGVTENVCALRAHDRHPQIRYQEFIRPGAIRGAFAFAIGDCAHTKNGARSMSPARRRRSAVRGV
ncbi:MAG: hypothetical protein M3303_07115, partial [Gemmatimonadota bacterium]|nr:hypothetical protein [Gemmatimonadota bacterium]